MIKRANARQHLAEIQGVFYVHIKFAKTNVLIDAQNLTNGI